MPSPYPADILLQKTFASIDDAVVVVERESRRILMVNPAFEQMFGYPAGEIVGQTTACLYPSPEDFLRAGEESRQAFQRQASYRGRFTMCRHGGEAFETYHTLSPIYGEDGRLVAAVSVIRDRTEWLSIEQRLAEQEQLLSGIADNLPGGIYRRVLWPDGRVEVPFFRGALAEALGLGSASREYAPGETLARVHPEDRAGCKAAIHASAQELSRLDMTFRILRPDGGSHWVRSVSQPTQRPDGAIQWDAVMLDVSREKRAEQDAHRLANYDQLTGLPNRGLFHQRLAQGLAAGGKLAVVAVNLDRFKYINSTYGIAAGDALLIETARRLRSLDGAVGAVARVGADEFLVLLEGLPDADAALPELHAIEQVLARPYRLAGRSLHLSASLGLAVAPEDGTQADTLLTHADAALHRARSQGPGRTEFYSADITAGIAARTELERELREALKRGELIVHYQPQVACGSGHIRGLEALVRWRHPERGLVLPGEFIAVAEETGLIRALGEEVLHQVCRQQADWLDAGVPVVPVSVNLSVREIDDELAERVQGVLARYGLEPGLVELELTETSLMQDPGKAGAVLRGLFEQGLRFALDDFGTGYSALGYLQRFPFAKLKIDRSFIAGMAEDADQASLVRAIIAMASSLHMHTVAEGVETERQLRALEAMGCDLIQGWLYGPAEPAEVVAGQLQRGVLELLPGAGAERAAAPQGDSGPA